ncbi:MAG: hypothetical protein IT258_01525 [Saprospiraceae bacterium]|nr:hypothetical protein [Saprospiraceae bacterium]
MYVAFLKLKGRKRERFCSGNFLMYSRSERTGRKKIQSSLNLQIPVQLQIDYAETLQMAKCLFLIFENNKKPFWGIVSFSFGFEMACTKCKSVIWQIGFLKQLYQPVCT